MSDKNINFTITKITPIEYCGKPRFFQLDGIDNSYEPPLETKPTSGEHDFNTCSKCQEDLLTLVNILTKKYKGNDSKKGFPYCCEGHSKLIDLVNFKSSDYEKEPTLVANKIIYTYSHIRNVNTSETFYKEATDYIDYTIESFGKMQGIVDPLFLSDYIFYIKFLINQSVKIDKNKKKLILDYLEAYFKPNNSSSTDLNILIQIYEKWLKEFPFELNSYFGNLKEQFEKQIPLFNGPPEINKYSGKVKIKPHTKSSLIDFLTVRTNELLTNINGVTLLEKGLISDSNKLKLDLVICDRKLKLKQ